MGDQNVADDDPRVKSNKRGNKETKNSKVQIKQEHTREQNEGNTHSDSVQSDSPANRVPDVGVQSKADKSKGTAKNKQEFKYGCLVWHRIKGFPWWPGIVVNESDVAESQRKVDNHHLLKNCMA